MGRLPGARGTRPPRPRSPSRFDSAAACITRLTTAHAEGRLEREVRRLNRYRLLIIDLCRDRDDAEGVVRRRRAA